MGDYVLDGTGWQADGAPVEVQIAALAARAPPVAEFPDLHGTRVYAYAVGVEGDAALDPGPAVTDVPVHEDSIRAMRLVAAEHEAATVKPEGRDRLVLVVHEQKPIATAEIMEAFTGHVLFLSNIGAQEALAGKLCMDPEKLFSGGLLYEIERDIRGSGEDEGTVALDSDTQRLAPVAAAKLEGQAVYDEGASIAVHGQSLVCRRRASSTTSSAMAL